jgi:beta-phosphoglucomutase-like phosphatase (HAD superfamily)
MEDSLAGIAAGKAAGIFTVGITTTFDRGALRASGADRVVDSFAELRNVLKEV